MGAGSEYRRVTKPYDDTLSASLLARLRAERRVDARPGDLRCVDELGRFALVTSGDRGTKDDLEAGEVACFAREPEESLESSAAGRRCARSALAAIGQPRAAILRDGAGAPRWPVGVSGSISHAEGMACALVGSRLGPIGVDVERLDRRVRSRAWRAILRPEEICAGHLERLVVFSLKEAFFKMCFPRLRRFFWFDVARVTLGDTANRCSITIMRDLCSNLLSGTTYWCGYWLFESLVVSWVFDDDLAKVSNS